MTTIASPDPAFISISDLLAQHAAANPRHMALIEAARSIDYGELDHLANRVAASLQRDGLEPQQCVAICAAGSIDYAVAFLGALRAGAVVAPLAPSSTPDALAAMLRDCEATHLLLDAASAGLLDRATSLPALRRVMLDSGGDSTGSAAAPGSVRWLDWLGDANAARPVKIEPSWAFNIIYSSGTTGTPKGIMQPHSMRWMHINRGRLTGYGPDAVVLLSTPMYSNTTLVSLFPAIGLGGAAAIMPKFDATGFLEMAQKVRATHAMLVPVQYQRLMAHPDFDRYDLSAFRMKFSTSAPFAPALKADVLRRWPGGLVEYYGMTEGGGTCTLAAHLYPDKLHTVGLPAPGHDIRLIDEQGKQVEAGETGEIVGHSGSMMTGYFKQADKTAEAEWFDPSGKRFIRTGDLGHFDADGFLVLLDRKKDMIISGGFNIYPTDLEAVLLAHPAVADAAVVGVPSEKWGETPVAFVVARSGHTANEAALLAWCNERLGKMQRIAAVRLLDTLPRSPIGKVLKRELRDRFSDNV
ncbi:class I adenylate-forming enzyme family protein [Lacisediminimonas sp.]|uniref:class I adenylate-forming enzyme family protein n=1 Tax=Lacisediminimonas sp. TaxID=3060582 RepID=UPI002727AAC0|nr:class I adenylate-forming enzyme family protein [Lacisediminimonas sp.]MDO8299722.1 class I adenylate-forming enzyme family protein [Lacisediminimonas sp.]